MILSFELNLRPLAHQSVRIGRGGIKYKPKKVLDYQKYVRTLIENQLPKNFNIIHAGCPIKVNYIEYVYAYPKTMAKKRRILKTPKVTKPDLQDNLNKAFFDALEGLIYEQDQNIVEINNMAKYYGPEDKIRVQFEYE
jgi:Holliday junction resolvase RusA-like endonuclease